MLAFFFPLPMGILLKTKNALFWPQCQYSSGMVFLMVTCSWCRVPCVCFSGPFAGGNAASTTRGRSALGRRRTKDTDTGKKRGVAKRDGAGLAVGFVCVYSMVNDDVCFGCCCVCDVCARWLVLLVVVCCVGALRGGMLKFFCFFFALLNTRIVDTR